MHKIHFAAAAPILAGAVICAFPVQAQEGGWSGGYGSLSVSSAKVSGDDKTLTFDSDLDGKYGDTVKTFGGMDAFAPGFCKGAAKGKTPADGCSKSDSESGVGLRLGYDWQTDRFVYGVVADISSAKFTDAVSGFSTTPDAYTFSRRVKNVTGLRGRAGYVFGDWLAYGTAGFAWADIDRTFTTTNPFNSFTGGEGKDLKGYQVGLGVEKKISGNWSVGLEYLRTSLRDKGAVVHAGPSASTFASNPFLTGNAMGTDIKRSDDRFETDSLLLTVSYRFGAMSF